MDEPSQDPAVDRLRDQVADATPPSSRQPFDKDDHRLLVLPATTDLWPLAALGGILDVNDRGCVSLRVGDAHRLILAEHGARVTDRGEIVFNGSARTYLRGDTVEGTGGEVTSPAHRDLWRDCVAEGADEPIWVFRL